MPEPLTKQQNENLRRYIRTLKETHTQVELAQKLGVTQATISTLLSETGNRGGSLKLATRVGLLLRKPLHEVLGDAELEELATLSGTSSMDAKSEVEPGPLSQAIEANVENWKYAKDVAKALRAVGHRNYSAEQWVILGNFFDQALGNAELFASGERRASQKKQAAR